MKGQEIIEYIVYNRLYEKEFELVEAQEKTRTPRAEKELRTLSEISTVTYEYGRVVLTIHDGKYVASRKFGLHDDDWKYEFDGGSMYFYKVGSETSRFNCSCGKGGYTLVSNSLEKCIKAVKTEMIKQIYEKKIKVPREILCDLPYSTYGNIYAFTWCM